MRLSSLVGAFAALSTSFVHAATTWKSVKIGGGGGFVCYAQPIKELEY